MNFYGDDVRWFIGKVILINEDEYRLGRVKVRIFGIHDDDKITDTDLPLAQVLFPSTEGGSSGVGATVGIQPGAQVFGVFLDGKDSQLPLILGSIPKIEVPSKEKILESTDIPENKKKQRIERRPGEVGISDDDLPGKTNLEKAFIWLLSPEGGGFTVNQAAGICGNLRKESYNPSIQDIDPTITSAIKGEYSFGIAQWNPAVQRKQKLQAFCEKNKLKYDSLYGQLRYLTHDMFNGEYKRTGPAIKQMKTIEEVAEYFLRRYEIAADNSDDRLKYAKSIKKKFVG
jgi:hypothetical protein